MDERRSSSRIRAYRPVRLQIPSTLRIMETLTKDLSVGGICCISTVPFPVTAELNLEIGLSTGREPIMLRGKMSWFRMLPHSDQFDIGMSFVNPSAQDIRRLSTYLGRLAEQWPLVHSS